MTHTDIDLPLICSSVEDITRVNESNQSIGLAVVAQSGTKTGCTDILGLGAGCCPTLWTYFRPVILEYLVSTLGVCLTEEQICGRSKLKN